MKKIISGKIVPSIDLSIIEANWIVFMGSKLSLFDNKIIVHSLLGGKLLKFSKFFAREN